MINDRRSTIDERCNDRRSTIDDRCRRRHRGSRQRWRRRRHEGPQRVANSCRPVHIGRLRFMWQPQCFLTTKT